MNSSLPRLIAKLCSAVSFEDAAEAALRAVIDVAEAALAKSRFAGSGRILRAMVHLRPDDGYVRLVVLEAAGGPDGAGAVTLPAHVPSATAWRWVRAHEAPIAVDVLLQMVVVQAAVTERASSAEGAAPSARGEAFDAGASRMKLLDREATHLLALPLRAPGGRVDGMLSIEADCRAAMGTGFVWDACKDELEAACAVAAPHLSALPAARAEPPAPDPLLPVIGERMRPVVQMLGVFARQEETLLIGGPTGAGKSRLARWCHAKSAAQSGPFETLDLSTVPEELQMAELFGWRKGAFTGALRDTPGAIARAERGTLFIDEIDKLSLKAQAGLLRMLEEKRYRPIGEGAGDREADVRFVIGTNADLSAMARRGEFRTDLYYRINVLPVKVPPLRNRLDEIGSWASFLLDRRHRTSGAPGRATLAAEAEPALVAYDWPGNLRQLDNMVRRAYAIALAEGGGGADGVLVSKGHVEKAFAYESEGAQSSLLELLERTAEAFVREAERRPKDRPLDLDVAEGLKGLVLEAGRRRFGGGEGALRKALLLLGKHDAVASRNYPKLWKKEAQKAAELRRALSETRTDGDPDEGPPEPDDDPAD